MYTILIISLVIITFSYWFTLQMRNKHFSYYIFLWIGKKITDLQRALYPPKYIVLDELGGVLMTNVMYELAKLEIADIIKAQGGKMNIRKIAKITGTDEDKLNRLLRFAASKGFFRILDDGVYANNSISLTLSKDHPDSLRNNILLFKELEISSIVKTLSYELKLQTDNEKEQMTSFAKSHNGLEFYEWLSLPENKERQEIFNKAMIEQDSSSEKGLNQDYDWSQYCNAKFVDFAGGIGSYLSKLMTRYPTMKGVLYEIPSVIEMSEKLWSINHKQLLNRVQFVRGDFFINPPPPADVYFLRSILHNWPDEKAIKILKTVRSAISLTNVSSKTTSYFKPKLLIAERVIDDDTPAIIYQVDIMMMFMANGKERTKPEIENLLDKSGWKFTKITSCRGGFSIIEAVPI
ncbi:O-methyltransferase-domain-containing protein [Gigaspora rosea]|uniref:O-methyltransferase-domain-containing protein n=1 Tax=Gigaspora rosea TaxID=44941 RepID=A0A397VCW5_9GLOM|nr:O-methyltransferase-domain-containing protein [Gigaspora rosea]